MEALAVLLVLVAVVAAIIAAVVAAHEDSHAGRVARMQAKHQDALRQIDGTAEYYSGLYRYIARRLDHESGRRQSG
jgi:hypothetical protein